MLEIEDCFQSSVIWNKYWVMSNNVLTSLKYKHKMELLCRKKRFMNVIKMDWLYKKIIYMLL